MFERMNPEVAKMNNMDNAYPPKLQNPEQVLSEMQELKALVESREE